MSAVDLVLEGGQPLRLLPADFRAAGGQGEVYVQGPTAYKLARDPAQALRAARRDALARLRHPAVVVPARLIFTPDGAPAGHSMRALGPGLPWAAAAPTAAWDHLGLDLGGALHLCARLAEAVAQVHQDGAVIADWNPLNVHIRDDLDQLDLIDVDAWAVPGFPAQALLPAYDDPRRAGPPAAAGDWWGVAVLCFQLVTGLHPFRGHHPQVTGPVARAQARLSALHPAVRVPPSTRPWAGLPPAWRAWLEATFHGEHRGPPPSAAAPVAVAAAPAAPGPAELEIRPLPGPAGPLRGLRPAAPTRLCWTADQFYEDGRPLRALDHPVHAVGRGPAGEPVLAWVADGRLRLVDARQGRPLPLDLAARGVTDADGRLIVLAGDALLEVQLVGAGGQLHAGLRRLAGAHPQATTLHDGLALTLLPGAAYAVLPMGPGRAATARVPALDGSRVLQAAHRQGVVALLRAAGDGVERLILRFDPSCGRHDLRADPDAGLEGLAVLPGGVVAVAEPEGLLLLGRAPGSPLARAVPWPAAAGPAPRHLGCEPGQPGLLAALASGAARLRLR